MRLFAFFAASMLCLSSCSLVESRTARLWTDNPQFALYAAAFNSAQSKYILEVHYDAKAASSLAGLVTRKAKSWPDLVVASWLRSGSAKTASQLWRNLNGFDAGSFYASLLKSGQVGNKQYLLPVSFNLPALVLKTDNEGRPSSSFTIKLDEIRSLGKAYDNDGQQMGFSPVWNKSFLPLMARLEGVDFAFSGKTGTEPLAWNNDKLQSTLSLARDWVNDEGAANIDDFIFKYFYQSEASCVSTGRILFCYMTSSDFFSLNREQRRSLTFRWIASDSGSIPVDEDTVYLGICKYGRGKQAAEAFVKWFFREDVQHSLLSAGTFGIAGGFSTLKNLTSLDFPVFYPALLGHVPDEEILSPGQPLPRTWPFLDKNVITPWLYSFAHGDSSAAPGATLEKKIAAWLRQNNAV
jgi:ABC-type glycerol-3-phosphate transport system substrate-binding protein